MPYVQLRDFRMHYSERGTGDTALVFVAGFISTQRWWQPTLERLSERDYHAYAIDLRATGQSEDIATGHTLAQYAEDLHQFAEALGLRRFVLVGHSMGGGIAMQYALAHQDHLQAIVLVDPLAASGTTLTPEVTAWLNAQCGNPEGIRGIVLGAFATPPTPPYLDELVEDGVRWGQPIFLGTMADMARFNITAQLPQLTVPTLMTWSDKDVVIPFKAIVEIFTAIPGCGLTVWHGVGHSAPIEIPDQFVALLTGFIAEAAQQARESEATPAAPD
jgi:pimeloyl-ACP methyl ester carboxylesterase